MRTSLLLQREPFGRILEETLERYWSSRGGARYAVTWYPRNPGEGVITKDGSQAWFGNIYFNYLIP